MASLDSISLTAWSYDPVLGIVHETNCQACLEYKAHVTGANNKAEASYLSAQAERNKELTNRFLEGFRHGRYTQRTHDNERLREYIAQRDDARHWMLSYKDDLVDAKNEIGRLQSELQSVRGAYDALSKGQELSDQYSSSLSITRNETNSPSSDSELSSVLDEELASFSVSDGELTIPDTNDNESRVEITPRPETPVDEVPNFQSSQLDETLGCSHSYTSSTDSWHLDVIPHVNPSENDNLPSDNGSLPSRADYEDVNYIASLIEQAHDPDNSQANRATTLIKSLCARAHSTPAHSRTEGQLYLLREWRCPSPILFASTGPVAAPLEAYVDASGTGIGFIKDNKWEAWSLKKGWNRAERDITWAEAVAVEMGLRVLIQAGHRDTRIVIRSDSMGVINAIKNRPFKKAWNEEVSIRIRNLCHVHFIDLQLRWISTDKNPADHPSRGKHGCVEDRFLPSFDIPSHLVDFVEPLVL